MNLLIWWLNQADTEAVSEKLNGLPGYLRSQVNDRYGRSGRGRLWIHKSLPSVGVDPWPDTQLAKELGGQAGPEKDAGGIVFKDEDLPLVQQLPGLVTDLKLNIVEK